jgi:hypothetical protein
MRKLLLLTLLMLMLANACIKRDEYPIEPYIEFVSLTKIQNGNGPDNMGLLTLFFTDGDGDMGLRPEDTIAPYEPTGDFYYNFFISYLEKENGVYDTVVLPFTNNARIPLLNPDLVTKPIKGDIEIELFINNPLSTADTIAFDIYIVDRALHKSNVIRTPDIPIKKQ